MIREVELGALKSGEILIEKVSFYTNHYPSCCFYKDMSGVAYTNHTIVKAFELTKGKGGC